MFGISKTALLGGALAVAGAGVGGFFFGREVGKDSVTVQWQEEQIANRTKQLEYERRLFDISMELQLANSRISDEVQTEYVDRVRTITETKYQNRDVIREVFKETPFLSQGWVYAHNQLVRGESIDPQLASDRTPSTFTEEDSLETISENYSIARQGIQKDESWQTFYTGVYDNFRLAGDGVRKDDNTAGDSTTSTASR